MSSATNPFHAHRLLVSPDGMQGANVHPLDAPNPLYADWTDLTDLDDNEFFDVVASRQRAHMALEAQS